MTRARRRFCIPAKCCCIVWVLIVTTDSSIQHAESLTLWACLVCWEAWACNLVEDGSFDRLSANRFDGLWFTAVRNCQRHCYAPKQLEKGPVMNQKYISLIKIMLWPTFSKPQVQEFKGNPITTELPQGIPKPLEWWFTCTITHL